jgi:hypothetical protein
MGSVGTHDAALLPNSSQLNVRLAVKLCRTDVLERMASGRIKVTELERLLPWNWQAEWIAAVVDARTP